MPQQINRYIPKSIDTALDQIIENMSQVDKTFFTQTKEEDLYQLQFARGQYLYNKLYEWDMADKHIDALHGPDGVFLTDAVIKLLWRKLQESHNWSSQ